MIISLEEVKEYARIDDDGDDVFLKSLIAAAEGYLRSATGKEYPEADEDGNKIAYGLEKIYLQQLVAYWYEKRIPGGGVGDDFCLATKALMLQLRMK